MEKLTIMNKIFIYLKWVFPFLISPLVLSGCWDRREINDMAFVLATAVDKEKDQIRVSILIPLPGNMGGTGGGGGGTGGVEPYTIETEVANTPWEAVNKIQSRLPRKIFFAHRRVLLFGEDFAKEGIAIALDNIVSRPGNRLSTFVAITKGKAADYLDSKVKLERFSAEQMRELLQSDATIKTSIKDIIANMNLTGHDAFISYLELAKADNTSNRSDNIQATGFSITKDGKQVDVLKGKEAFAMRILTPKFRSYSETLKLDDEKFSFQILSTSTQINPKVYGNQISFDISVVAIANIAEFFSNKNIFKEIPNIKRQIELQMKLDLLKTLDILKMKGSDVVGFGQILNRHYPQKWVKDWEPHWDNLFAKTNFNVSVKVNIYDVGATSENMAKKEN
jgi:Ger(x)C family germination protein